MTVTMRLIQTFRRFYWKIFNPTTVGVRAIILDQTQTNVLLVKHSYSDQWYLPGGKVNKFESFENAIKRELKEELNVLISDIELFGVYSNFSEGKNDTIIVFKCSCFGDVSKNSYEINEFGFFKLSELPTDISAGTCRRIAELKSYHKPVFGIW